jgi:hypothetical protein
MNFKVGVFAEGQFSGEMMSETKKVLQEIALKYKCRFELKKGVNVEEEKNQTVGKGQAKFKAKFNDQSKSNNGDVFLSFGGEIEI